MLVFRHIAPLKVHLSSLREQGVSTAFIPTMGALHNGHLSLIAKGASHADQTVASVYVNPTQFNDSDDFEKYPRTTNDDLEMLYKAGCSVVWLPSDKEMYPEGKFSDKVDFGTLTNTLEGEHRPGHFDGMATVVNLLLTTVDPDFACFGEKDFQQLAIIKAMVQQKGMSVQIVPCPIVREPSGLARSSRNERLSPEDRVLAAKIFAALLACKQKASAASPAAVLDHGRQILAAAQGVNVEYLALVDSQSFKPITAFGQEESARLLVAAYVGGIRLIDNLAI